MVLLHGAGARGRVWEPVRRRLPGHWRVATPDLPGRDGVDTPRTAAGAAAVIAATVLDPDTPAVVVGHSYGGAVAITLAMHHGHLLSRLVLVSTGARLRVHPSILAMTRAAVQQGEAARLGQLGFLPEYPEQAAAYGDVEVGGHPAAAAADWMACDGFDHLGDIGGIEVPTAVMSGTRDVLTPPRYGRYLADHIPGCEHHLIEDAGHMAPFERPDAFASLLLGVSGR